MEQREIELTIISAQDLKNVKSFGGKMSPYAVAWVYPNMKVPTPMAPSGGENPTWNANLKLVCEERLVEQGNLVITIDVYNHSSFSNKSIGSASLPLPQNMTGDGKSQGSKNGTQSKVISLPVRRPSGRVQGTLNVAVKLGELITNIPAAWGSSNVATDYNATGRGKNEPMTAYPAAGYPAGFNLQGAGGSSNQQYAAAYPQYPPQYASQQVPYYPPAGAGGGSYMQPPPPPRRNGFGGAGLGTGLLGGALGGLLLGDVLGGGFGGGGCGGGGGGCGGGGCGGG
ncbi:unnamed protein product [Sphagnum balticum]